MAPSFRVTTRGTERLLLLFGVKPVPVEFRFVDHFHCVGSPGTELEFAL